MGGKGGGSSSNEEVENVISQVYNGQFRQKILEERAAGEDAWQAKFGPGGSGNSFYMKVFGPEGASAFEKPKAAEPEPEPVVEAPAPVAAAPDPLANMPAAPATDTTVAPPASMAAGDTLGGAVLKPPRYWTGGLDQYESANRTGRGTTGAMKTTQT